MTALPTWLTDDADERAELAALGISADVSATPDDQAARDAQASTLLRALGRVEAEIGERRRALQIERDQLERIYGSEIERLERRQSFLAGAIEALAVVSEFGPKKKSRAVGFGTYGLRQSPLKVEVLDEDAVLDWAMQGLPEAVSATVTLTGSEVNQIVDAGLGECVAPARLRWALAKSLLKGHVESTGETEIPGIRVELPIDKPFAKAMAPKDGAR